MKRIFQNLFTVIFSFCSVSAFSQNQVYWKEGFEPMATPACNLTVVNPSSFVTGYFNGNAGTWYGGGIYRTTGTGCPFGNNHLRFRNIAGVLDSGFVITPIVSFGIGEFHFKRARASRSYTLWITPDTLATTTNWFKAAYLKVSAGTVICNDTGIVINSPYARRLKIVSRVGTDTDIDSIWMTSYSKIGLANIKGTVFEDLNNNGIRDLSERGFVTMVQSTNQNQLSFASLSLNGRFNTSVDTGTFITTIPQLYKPYYICNPLYKTSHLDSSNLLDSVDFAFTPIPNKNDLKLGLFSPSLIRLGRNAEYCIGYVNVGTTTQNATLVYIKDPRVNIINTVPSYNIKNGDSIIWNLQNLLPDSMGYIKIYTKVAIPPIAKLGDTLKHFAILESANSDETPNNNKQYFLQRVIGSYDPNDKQEAHNGVLTTTQLAQKEDLVYTIRFQNTGNDTAFDISITDDIDNKLDLNSFELIGKSHPCSVSVNEQRITFTFNNIYLADSNVNEPESHGYITYKIKAKTTLAVGDTIKNSAAIYFDLNDAVITNTNKTIISNPLLAVSSAVLKGTINNNKTSILTLTLSEKHLGKIILEKSKDGIIYFPHQTIENCNLTSIKFSDNLTNKALTYYRVMLIEENGNKVFSNAVLLQLKNELSYTIYPNPVKDKLIVEINSNENTATINANIYNLNGMLNKKIVLKNNATNIINTSEMQSGLFILSLNNGTNIRFIKQ